ncbi:MAG: adenylosuccinate synthase [Bacteroidales bacterium]|nr:adenylosuccinate synthase [Bacteroidales bacterium]
MKIDVLLGLQWGDEGKGKVVDVLTPRYDVITRFQGGPNAGHTLEFNNRKHILHNIPSGVFREEKINIIANGVVLDPVVFRRETDTLEAMGVDLTRNLWISRKAHLIIPTHRILDAASEAAKGKSKIGSTLRGISPTYMDKTGRNGLRVGDIELNFREKYEVLKEKHLGLLRLYDFEYTLAGEEEKFFEGIEAIRRFRLVNSEYEINSFLESGNSILAEGAQGTLLDIDFGSYPYVTSSNTICAGACTGMGVAPSSIGEVYGVFKAYCTRVGSGPFPTELFGEEGDRLRDIGKEFGSTTGRPRRCGWLDLVSLKYSLMLNGVTQLIMTKTDVLDSFETIRAATAYSVNGILSDRVPYNLDADVDPIYTDLPGWKTDLTGIRSKEQFPPELKDYILFLEKELQTPVRFISVGPDRNQIIEL